MHAASSLRRPGFKETKSSIVRAENTLGPACPEGGLADRVGGWRGGRAGGGGCCTQGAIPAPSDSETMRHTVSARQCCRPAARRAHLVPACGSRLPAPEADDDARGPAGSAGSAGRDQPPWRASGRGGGHAGHGAWCASRSLAVTDAAGRGGPRLTPARRAAAGRD